ncbi:dTDP-4-dehydrorhamnose 3,5-epimerase [Chryseolinea lacunae]|uniref:dTDP-4-dehydrorhamnose 3,5-epimerase n=1 Tax=Chryseolinea lacunae TaxID=2801331 RepID=A0ABS1KKT3_9BACT|nr:dTDP-4-dehydrorhamnose 3,5-epimerase [Chryseolinea lacunae]MBL0740071.1 dTDP-4-dehydrorhamnose 3,5-epimerase [Chryseolinea lacunae]
MEVKATGMEGLVEIYPTLYKDDRGWFYEFYKDDTFKKHNISYTFLQENQSFSKKGVVRGLHMQRAPYAQAKLVTCLAGKVLDVVVDLRAGSKTFAQVYYCLLESEKRNMLMVPEGFAHGFAALEDSVFFYKCSNLYDKASETGVRWNDPALNIDWRVQDPIISEKDMVLPTMDELLRKSVISR